MTKKVVKFSSQALSQLLHDMNEEGGFSIAVITDREGFSIASAAQAGQDPDTQSAVVALVQKTAQQVSHQLGLSKTDEISLYDEQGQRLVCRPFSINGHDMILAVTVPHRGQSYRRVTNKGITAIQRHWKL